MALRKVDGSQEGQYLYGRLSRSVCKDSEAAAAHQIYITRLVCSKCSMVLDALIAPCHAELSFGHSFHSMYGPVRVFACATICSKRTGSTESKRATAASLSASNGNYLLVFEVGCSGSGSASSSLGNGSGGGASSGLVSGAGVGAAGGDSGTCGGSSGSGRAMSWW